MRQRAAGRGSLVRPSLLKCTEAPHESGLAFRTRRTRPSRPSSPLARTIDTPEQCLVEQALTLAGALP